MKCEKHKGLVGYFSSTLYTRYECEQWLSSQLRKFVSWHTQYIYKREDSCEIFTVKSEVFKMFLYMRQN